MKRPQLLIQEGNCTDGSSQVQCQIFPLSQTPAAKQYKFIRTSISHYCPLWDHTAKLPAAAKPSMYASFILDIVGIFSQYPIMCNTHSPQLHQLVISYGKNSFWAQSSRLTAVNQPTLSFVTYSVKYFFSLTVLFTWFHLILCNTSTF